VFTFFFLGKNFWFELANFGLVDVDAVLLPKKEAMDFCALWGWLRLVSGSFSFNIKFPQFSERQSTTSAILFSAVELSPSRIETAT